MKIKFVFTATQEFELDPDYYYPEDVTTAEDIIAFEQKRFEDGDFDPELVMQNGKWDLEVTLCKPTPGGDAPESV